MRIDNTNPAAIANQRARETDRPDDATPRGDLPEDEAAVVVSIGKAAYEAAAVAERLPESMRERLEAIRAQLQAGTYQVDFGKLAHRLVDEEQARRERT